MKQDEIIKLARECGHPYPQADAAFLADFSALVAAAEREECAKVCDELVRYTGYTGYDCASAIRARNHIEQPLPMVDCTACECADNEPCRKTDWAAS